jgi:hypothetical protein
MNCLSLRCAALVLAVLVLAIQPLRAQDESCAAPVPSPRLTDYRAVFLACVNDAGAARLAIRRMRTDAGTLLLTVDPKTLATRLEPESCWRCAETTDEAQSQTRFVRALQGPAQGGDAAKTLKNAGLVHSESGAGAFVTGDLCPSRHPLDRGFFERLAREGGKTPGTGTPVALSVSGIWLAHHAGDLEWLKRQEASGTLAITWVNHSYSHPYAKHRPDGQNFMLTQGLDFDQEVYGAERAMIEAGLTPSVFFRFPGLVSDAVLNRRLRESHLVALGADAWLAIGQSPRPGSIVLVHPNGNEPGGIKLLSQLLDQGRLPKPLRPIGEAPADSHGPAAEPGKPADADAGFLPLDMLTQRLMEARKWMIQEVKP